MPQTPSAKSSETVTRIIAAAKDVFAEEGYAGARVDEIARRAGVNKAALYYHIGDKEALYAEAIHDVIGATSRKIAEEIARIADPEEKLRTYVRSLTETISRNPQLPRIMMRELASGGQHLPEVFFQDIALVFNTITGIIEDGVRSGVFVETIPLLVHLMTMGSIFFSKVSGPLIATHPAAPETLKNLDPKLLSVVDAEIERLILRSIKA